MSISEIIALSGHVEKLGIIGVLVVVCAVLAWALFKLRKELATVYTQRDKARLALVKCRAALDQAGIKVDLSDIADLIGAGET